MLLAAPHHLDFISGKNCNMTHKSKRGSIPPLKSNREYEAEIAALKERIAPVEWLPIVFFVGMFTLAIAGVLADDSDCPDPDTHRQTPGARHDDTK